MKSFGNIFLMDAGFLLWEFEGGFGTALGQLGAQLKGCGTVLKASEAELPTWACPCDYVVVRKGFPRDGIVTVSLQESMGKYLVSFQCGAWKSSDRLLESVKKAVIG